MLAALAGACLRVSAAQDKNSLKKLKGEIGLLESVLNQDIAQTFSAPFGFLDRARGAYLPGYGVVFDFELNLTPSARRGPFSPALTAQQEKAQREEEMRRQKQAKELAESVLADFGHTLSQLPVNESVAIVIHTVAAGDQGFERSVIVVQSSKKALDEYRSSRVDRAGFLQSLRIVEY